MLVSSLLISLSLSSGGVRTPAAPSQPHPRIFWQRQNSEKWQFIALCEFQFFSLVKYVCENICKENTFCIWLHLQWCSTINTHFASSNICSSFSKLKVKFICKIMMLESAGNYFYAFMKYRQLQLVIIHSWSLLLTFERSIPKERSEVTNRAD